MIKRYTFRGSRFHRSQMEGFQYSEQGYLILTEKTDRHIIFFPSLDSGSNNTCWGRFSFLQNLSKETVCTVYAAVTTEPMDIKKKEVQAWIKHNGITVTGQKDILLYELKGRYLWCCIEVLGEGSGEISNLFVELPGDNFMATFPEIYQDEGSFFQRYLSIFSSMYNDYQKKIDEAWRYLDLDEAPGELLVYYAKWLGLSIEKEILEESVLRNLVKNLYSLYKIKGTKKVLHQLVKILLNKECIVVERNRLGIGYSNEEERLFNRLYGKGMQDVTLMINQKAEEKTQARLLFFLKQFVPIRCRLNLVFYGECSNMDSYCFLDKNARLYTTPKGSLDEQKLLDESTLNR